MKINDAHELQAIISSIRKKAFEEVAKLIKSDAVTKDTDGFILMYEEDLIKLINAIDSSKIKKQKEEAQAESDNLA